MNEFVYGNMERIFVNTDMGCAARCSYCYLPSMGIKHGIKKIDAAEAVDMVESMDYYREGKGGSIISIGCYSECMDSENIEDTFQVVRHFLKRGNYVQLATKKEISREFLQKIAGCRYEKHQLWIYVSLPVITDSLILEAGTDAPEKRIRNFDLCKEFGIDSVLYIKPYLEKHTDKDREKYMKIITKYDIPVVIGEMLDISGMGKAALVGENRLFGHKTQNMEIFITEVKKISKVYQHSTECIR